ncbi:hypothetical protein [Kitasatospora sp. A2-31]|uniref:hypothetical protein n=1 Tax=Kitasatospora sp. A2-31 TaxID=2916414 RepID=UPI001EEB56D6|nr:hypothetical protein [Kitasatospora sp. A2-31]MCG6498470.1 hypothetical protein [Kitasatospora sp. A2-31]
MVKLHDILSVSPEALAVAGVVDWSGRAGARARDGRVTLDLPDPGRPWDWHWSADLPARLLDDLDLQLDLSRTWTESASGGSEPVRLALHGVPRAGRHALVTRLGQARPALGAVFVADDTLQPEPRWSWPLRVCTVTPGAAEGLFDVLSHDAGIAPLIDAYTLGEQDGDCDVLAVASGAELDALSTGGGLSAACLAWCGPRPPDRHELTLLDAAARNLGAAGWVVADLSATDAVDWLDRLVRNLSDNLPLDEAAGRAGSWLTVAHPGLAERRAVSDAVRDADSAARVLADRRAEPIEFDGDVVRELNLPDRPALVTDLTHGIAVEAAAARFSGRRLGGAVADAFRELHRVGVAPGRTNARFLQALVSDQESGERRLHAFRAAAVNDVHIRVGPVSAEWHALATEFPEQNVEFRGGEARLTVVLDEERDDAFLHQPMKITLPRRGASSEAVFPVEVGAQEPEIRCTARVFHRNRQLQRLEISGPVGATDEAVDGREITINGEAFSSLAEVPSPDGRDSEAVIRIVDDETAVIVTGGSEASVRIKDLDELRARIRDNLRAAVDADAVAEGPGPAAPDRLLRGLAQQGSFLFERLEQLGHGDLGKAASLQVVSAEAAELWPLEFVYDYGYPSDTARLCTGWQRALETGTCSCRPTRRPTRRPTANGRRTVCPLGFWGVRMVIERRVERARLDHTVVEASPPDAASALRPVNSVLFAASQVVRGADRDGAVGTLRGSLGNDGVYTANSWQKWREVVRAEGPALLLAVAHNARDEGFAPVLEIGKKSRPSRLPSLRIDRRDIVSELHDRGTGPIVMLLGCNTAQEDISWQNVAARFLEKSAPVVVGTLVPTLGRQAAVMAGIAAVMLAENTQENRSIGELVRDIRRRLLTLGYTLAMAVVAFGDARWLVGSRQGGEP